MEKKEYFKQYYEVDWERKWQLNHQGQRVKETSRRIICLLDNKEIELSRKPNWKEFTKAEKGTKITHQVSDPDVENSSEKLYKSV